MRTPAWRSCHGGHPRGWREGWHRGEERRRAEAAPPLEAPTSWRPANRLPRRDRETVKRHRRRRMQGHRPRHRRHRRRRRPCSGVGSPAMAPSPKRRGRLRRRRRLLRVGIHGKTFRFTPSPRVSGPGNESPEMMKFGVDHASC